MIGKDTFNKRDGDIQVYMFDHAILFTKPMKTKQHEQFKVYRRVSTLCILSSDHMHMEFLSLSHWNSSSSRLQKTQH